MNGNKLLKARESFHAVRGIAQQSLYHLLIII